MIEVIIKQTIYLQHLAICINCTHLRHLKVRRALEKGWETEFRKGTFTEGKICIMGNKYRIESNFPRESKWYHEGVPANVLACDGTTCWKYFGYENRVLISKLGRMDSLAHIYEFFPLTIYEHNKTEFVKKKWQNKEFYLLQTIGNWVKDGTKVPEDVVERVREKIKGFTEKE